MDNVSEHDGFTLDHITSEYSDRFKLNIDISAFKFKLDNTASKHLPQEILRIMDNFVEVAKSGLDPENDRISLQFRHPDLMATSIDIPLQRPKNLTGQSVFTHISKVFQSQESMALDGKLLVKILIAKGVQGRGFLSSSSAKSMNSYLFKKNGIVKIKNTDGLCLPRAIVVGRANIQYFKEKTLSRKKYRILVGSEAAHLDKQGVAARELCVEAGIDVADYVNGAKTFGMDEVRLFANLLAPRYGVSVHNSHTANAIVYETPNLAEAHWINLLNLESHFDPSRRRTCGAWRGESRCRRGDLVHTGIRVEQLALRDTYQHVLRPHKTLPVLKNKQ